MKTENVLLDIKEIFDRSRITYTPADVARMRYLCKIFVENMIKLRELCDNQAEGNGKMEEGNMRGQTDGNR